MKTNSIQYNVGQCRSCGQGVLMIVKEAQNSFLFIMCDDCSALWRTPKEAKAYYVSSLEGISPSEGVYFLEGDEIHFVMKESYLPIKNASMEDILRYDWEKHIFGNKIDMD